MTLLLYAGVNVSYYQIYIHDKKCIGWSLSPRLKEKTTKTPAIYEKL
jgi:hypothetical protein